MGELVALAGKDLRILLRDKTGFFFTFFFPLIFAVFFGTIFGSFGGKGSGTIKIAVVDEDGSEASRAFVESLDGTAELDVELMGRAQAVDLVRRGGKVAYVALPEGFGAHRDGIFWGDPPTIEIGLDPSRKAETAMLKGLLTKCVFEGLRELMTDPAKMHDRIKDWVASAKADETMDPVARGALLLFLPALDGFLQTMPADDASDDAPDGADADAAGGKVAAGAAFEPVAFESVSVTRERRGPKNPYQISFPQGIIWGVLGCSAAFGISLVVERTKGTLVRLRMAPIARWQILGGKAGACAVTTFSLMGVLFLLGTAAFDLRPSSFVLLLLAMVCVSLCFVGIMLLLSVLGKTEQAAGGIGWAVLMVMAMLGGGMVPAFFMPSWMQGISSLSPVKWAIVAMEGAIWRDFTFGEMVMPCLILVGVGAVCSVIGVRAFRWSEAS